MDINQRKDTPIYWSDSETTFFLYFFVLEINAWVLFPFQINL